VSTNCAAIDNCARAASGTFQFYDHERQDQARLEHMLVNVGPLGRIPRPSPPEQNAPSGFGAAVLLDQPFRERAAGRGMCLRWRDCRLRWGCGGRRGSGLEVKAESAQHEERPANLNAPGTMSPVYSAARSAPRALVVEKDARSALRKCFASERDAFSHSGQVDVAAGRFIPDSKLCYRSSDRGK